MLGAKAALAGVVMVLIAGRQANADGCFFRLEDVGRSSQLVASPKQEAILATDGNMVQVVLRTHFRAGPRELAWVVPVPARPANIQQADDSVFAKLEDMTAPRFYRIITDDGPHPTFGCYAGLDHSQSVATAPVLVRVEETGTAGIFDYTVLAAEDPAALTKWLNDNKYHVPDGAAAVLKRYVDLRWHWLAMKVRPEAGKQGTLAPHPIRYTYRNKELIFPLVISRLSAERESEIVLYVVGPHRYCCRDWGNTDLADCAQRREIRLAPEAAAKGSSPRSGTNYEEVVRQNTGGHGGHLFVAEFSKRWDLFGSSAGRGRRFDDVLDAKLIDSLAARQILTRLRAYVPAEAMDRDVTLIAAKEDLWLDNSAQVAAASAGPSRLAALAVVPAMLLLPLAALMMPTRRKSGRAIRRACLALACVAILAA